MELIGQVYLRYYGISTIPRYLYHAAGRIFVIHEAQTRCVTSQIQRGASTAARI